MKRCYIEKVFYSKTADLIAECDALCTTYAQKGYTLTLRQLFYQLVSTNRIENTVRAYKNLGVVVTDARYAGLLDWEHITDRIRVIKHLPRWENMEDFLVNVGPQFKVDTWQGQQYRPEIWIEKDALIELAKEAGDMLDVPYVAVKAYNSASAMWEAAKRFREYARDGQTPLILHLGDHDCTGDDCSRFLQQRMELLTEGTVELRRLALNIEQINHYELPPQPGKTTDPRFKGYVKKHHTDSVWELDALAPDVIVSIIEGGIREVMDESIRQQYLDESSEGRDLLKKAADDWETVRRLLNWKPKSTIDDFAGEQA